VDWKKNDKRKEADQGSLFAHFLGRRVRKIGPEKFAMVLKEREDPEYPPLKKNGRHKKAPKNEELPSKKKGTSSSRDWEIDGETKTWGKRRVQCWHWKGKPVLRGGDTQIRPI